jgi:hypothetical protein
MDRGLALFASLVNGLAAVATIITLQGQVNRLGIGIDWPLWVYAWSVSPYVILAVISWAVGRDRSAITLGLLGTILVLILGLFSAILATTAVQIMLLPAAQLVACGVVAAFRVVRRKGLVAAPAPEAEFKSLESSMSLIGCPACGRQISSEADACPQCGHPNRKTPPAATGLPSQCRSCGEPGVGACKACGRFYCARHGGVAGFGLAAPMCSVCYDANRLQVGCRAVLVAALGIGCLILAGALASAPNAGGLGVCFVPLGLLILLGAASLAWSAFRRFP